VSTFTPVVFNISSIQQFNRRHSTDGTRHGKHRDGLYWWWPVNPPVPLRAALPIAVSLEIESHAHYVLASEPCHV
jgi:hypothetical protein